MDLKHYFKTDNGKLYHGDGSKTLDQIPDKSVNCGITSPPYWGLRDYGCEGQMGLEKTPEEYVKNMVLLFRNFRRVLKDDGTLWLNLGDTYNGSGGPGSQYDTKDGKSRKGAFKKYKNPNRNYSGLKPKDLVGIPWRVAFALQADGWYLRQDIIWNKLNPMPESVTDRCTKSHEYIFLLSKSKKYYYDHEAIKVPAKRVGEVGKLGFLKGVELKETDPNYRGPLSTQQGNLVKTNKYVNKRSVWTVEDHESLIKYLHQKHPEMVNEYLNNNKCSVWDIATHPYKEAHFATFPPKLIEPCVLAGCPEGGTVIDIFNGAGTTWKVCEDHNRKYIGIELNKEYCEITKKRIKQATAQLSLPGF